MLVGQPFHTERIVSIGEVHVSNVIVPLHGGVYWNHTSPPGQMLSQPELPSVVEQIVVPGLAPSTATVALAQVSFAGTVQFRPICVHGSITFPHRSVTPLMFSL